MSLFLGNIHYWLYNKILWLEAVEEDVLRWADQRGLPAEEWKRRFKDEFGAPTGGRPLEEIIDTSNIHGWLQQKIQSAELRQAALITEIIGRDPQYMQELVNIFSRQGEGAAQEYGGSKATPEDIFKAINDYVVEGMPCDRVNEVVSNNSDEFVWETTTCLHTPYWKQVKGDVQNFYILREAWIKDFVKTLNPEYLYEKSQEGIHRVFRK